MLQANSFAWHQHIICPLNVNYKNITQIKTTCQICLFIFLHLKILYRINYFVCSANHSSTMSLISGTKPTKFLQILFYHIQKTTLCKQNYYGAVVTPIVLSRSQFSEMLSSSLCKYLSQEVVANPWDKTKEISMNTNKTQTIHYFMCQHRTLQNLAELSKNTGYATVRMADFSA